MKKVSNLLWIFIIVLSACQDDDNRIFDKTADERVSEAVGALKADLIAPANGWILKYKPTNESGSFYVFLTFHENNNVTIKSDLGASDGEYFEQTVTYRIDTSLGLELIFESYSFFSYLFEGDQATFGAEFEFEYVNKTPDNALVFRSKSDVGNPTIIALQEAAPNQTSYLSKTVSLNLNKFNESLTTFGTPSSRISFVDKDLAIFLSLDIEKRIARFNYVSLKSDLSQGQALNLETGYTMKQDSIVLDTPLKTGINGININIKSFYFTTLSETTTEYCPGTPKTVPLYAGVTSANEKIILEQTLFNNDGAAFETQEEIYIADVQNIFDENDERAGDRIAQDITGAQIMVMYNGYDTGNGPLYGLGFYIENADGTSSIAVREYTATYTANAIELTFDSEITFVRNPDTPADVTKMDTYLDLLTAGGKAYIYRLDDQFFEVYNPCSQWSFAFQSL